MVQVPDVVSAGLLGLRPKRRGFCRIILPTSCDTDFPLVDYRQGSIPYRI